MNDDTAHIADQETAMEYTFILRFLLSQAGDDMDALVERLGEAGCDDALVGSFLNDIRLYRYIFHNDSFSRAHLRKLKFDNFSEDAKVEIHGCQTAARSDNIVADFSKYLFEAGKTKSVVIGHTTSADPRINGEKTGIPDQDYRHLERAIYRGGKLLTRTKKAGALDERELAK